MRFDHITRPVCLLVVFVSASMFSPPAAAENAGVATVQGNKFMLNGMPFYYAGCNNYYQMVFAADPGLRPHVEEVQAEAAAMGLTVLRTWAFNDGEGQWNALQDSPGAYREYVFEALDYVLHFADLNGLRVIMPFVNNWDDYGGMNQYVAWSPGANQHDDFYTDDSCRVWYKNHVSAILNRTNTYNGRIYREDPTIFAWELANEPWCETDPSGATLQAWINEMSAYVKSIDTTHMLSTGSEGFYGPSGPDHNPSGWMTSRGVDFILNHSPVAIDFACVHAWPDHWGIGYTESMSWVRDHIDDCDSLLGKPVIIEEFGKERPQETRDTYFQGWYNEVYTAADAGEAAGGSNVWILYHDAYPDYDGFGVYYPADSSTCSIIVAEAQRMRTLITSSPEAESKRHPGFSLGRNFPNPFGPGTKIKYTIPGRCDVRLDVFGVDGRMVARLFGGPRDSGAHYASWDGIDKSGNAVASGIYFYRFQAGDYIETKRMILLK